MRRLRRAGLTRSRAPSRGSGAEPKDGSRPRRASRPPSRGEDSASSAAAGQRYFSIHSGTGPVTVSSP